MPEAPAAPPPAAPPAETPTPAATMVAPAPVPRPGTARDRLQQAVFKTAGVKPEAPPATSPSPPSPLESGTTTPEPKPEGEPESQASPAKPSATPPISTEGKPKPPSIGHLLNEEKKLTRTLQAEIAELRKNSPPAEEIKTLRETTEKLQSRNKELEEAIAFTDYTKSQEFADKYQKPYEQAWDRAMKDLHELTIDDAATGATRPISAQDILDLVNLSLPKARELAEQLYGNFADDVMAHRKEIRRLFDEQGARIEEVKKTGLERVKTQTKQQQDAAATLHASLVKTFAAANADAMTNKGVSPFIKESETDQAWNQSLAKGTNLFDSGFSQDPRAPGLTEEQREDIVHRHAAIRNRCRAYGPMKLQIQRLEKELAEAKGKLGNYRAAEPGGGEPRAADAPKAGSAMDRIKAEAMKLAH